MHARPLIVHFPRGDGEQGAFAGVGGWRTVENKDARAVWCDVRHLSQPCMIAFVN